MKTYCYILGGKLIMTSDSKIRKYCPEKTIAIEGMVYDQVIETNIEGRVCYEQGKIIAWENSKEKAEEDARIAQQISKTQAEHREKRPKEILETLADIAKQVEGLKTIWQSTKEVEAKIEELKNEFLTLKK